MAHLSSRTDGPPRTSTAHLRTGKTIRTFRRRLGEPDVEWHHGQTIEIEFNLIDARVAALTDKQGTVAQYSVSTTSRDYKPKIELTPAGGHSHRVVVLGEGTFLRVEESLQRQPERLFGARCH